MTKSALRQHYLTQRRALLPEDVAYRSGQIADRFLRQYVAHSAVKTLHTFLPIARQNEVDIWPIIHQIWQNFPTIQVAVSVTDTTSNQLTHYVLSPDTPLVENRWDIPEPKPESSVAIRSDQLDLVLVPLLAFDTSGHRVGYGKGYYDRFLAECRPDCQKVGLSLFDPIEHIDDVVLTDIRLNACLTPNHIFVFDN